jgi:hypothetical protein
MLHREAPGVSIPRRRSSGAIHGCVCTSKLQQRIGRCRYRAASLEHERADQPDRRTHGPRSDHV